MRREVYLEVEMNQKKGYDPVLIGRALTSLALRVAVAGYIVYLAWKILSGMLGGTSPIPSWGAWVMSLVLAAAAIGFCYYALREFLKARKSAEVMK